MTFFLSLILLFLSSYKLYKMNKRARNSNGKIFDFTILFWKENKRECWMTFEDLPLTHNSYLFLQVVQWQEAVRWEKSVPSAWLQVRD